MEFGPFTLGQLGERTLEHSDRGDFNETKVADVAKRSSPPLQLRLLRTRDSVEEMERIISSTDELARPLIEELESDDHQYSVCSSLPCLDTLLRFCPPELIARDIIGGKLGQL